MTMFQSQSDASFNFTDESSFGHFMTGLRALRRYSEETERDQPNRDLLTQNLARAYDNLNYCVTNYPDDFVPLYSLGLVLTMKNQFIYAQALADRNAQAEAAHAAQLGPPAPRPWPLLDHAADLFERAMHGSVMLAEAARFNLAHVYAKRDNGTDGVGDLNRALELLHAFSASVGSVPPAGRRQLGWFRSEREQMRERDYHALRFQVSILTLFVQTRRAFRDNPESIERSVGTVQQRIACEREEIAQSALPPPIKADLLADSSTKMGYLSYEAAMALPNGTEEKRSELLAEAQSELGQALLRKPNWNPPQIYMAQVLQALGRFEEARANLKAVLGNGTS